MKRLLLLVLLTCVTVPIASLLVVAQQPANALDTMSQDPNQWVMPLGNYSGTRHSKLNQITAANVGRLQVAWTMSLGTLRGQEGQPLVVGNMMYLVSSYPNFIYAIDLNSYWRIAWKFAPEQDKLAPSVACCDVVNRGVAYADGKIFATTLDATLYALDAKTGKELWRAKNGDPKLGQTMTSAPLVIRDKVTVGISGGEFGVRGYLTSYDINTGKQVWRAHSVGPDNEILFDPAKTIDGATQQPAGPNSSLKTWTNEEWRLGGGTTWGWQSYRSPAQLALLRVRQPWNLESRPAARRQQVVDDDLCQESGYGSRRVGVSDDASRRVGL